MHLPPDLKTPNPWQRIEMFGQLGWAKIPQSFRPIFPFAHIHTRFILVSLALPPFESLLDFSIWTFHFVSPKAPQAPVSACPPPGVFQKKVPGPRQNINPPTNGASFRTRSSKCPDQNMEPIFGGRIHPGSDRGTPLGGLSKRNGAWNGA